MSSRLLSPADLDRRAVLGGLQLALRAGVAAGIAFEIAGLLKLNFPIFAAVAAIIVTDLAPSQSRALGLHRIVATILGALCGGVLSTFLPPQAWAIGAGIAIAMLLTSVVQGKDGVRVAGFTCGIVIVNVGANPWHFAFDRLMETLLGIVVAWTISHVPKLIKLAELEKPEA
jgi:uncharacterized membrane protein YgaE (UPF0421/DUF939 family)